MNKKEKSKAKEEIKAFKKAVIGMDESVLQTTIEETASAISGRGPAPEAMHRATVLLRLRRLNKATAASYRRLAMAAEDQVRKQTRHPLLALAREAFKEASKLLE